MKSYAAFRLTILYSYPSAFRILNNTSKVTRAVGSFEARLWHCGCQDSSCKIQMMRFTVTSDEKWASRHFDRLVEKYGGNYVGILGKKVLASGKTPASVITKSGIKDVGKLYLFKVPAKKDLVCLL